MQTGDTRVEAIDVEAGPDAPPDLFPEILSQIAQNKARNEEEKKREAEAQALAAQAEALAKAQAKTVESEKKKTGNKTQAKTVESEKKKTGNKTQAKKDKTAKKRRGSSGSSGGDDEERDPPYVPPVTFVERYKEMIQTKDKTLARLEGDANRALSRYERVMGMDNPPERMIEGCQEMLDEAEKTLGDLNTVYHDLEELEKESVSLDAEDVPVGVTPEHFKTLLTEIQRSYHHFNMLVIDSKSQIQMLLLDGPADGAGGGPANEDGGLEEEAEEFPKADDPAPPAKEDGSAPPAKGPTPPATEGGSAPPAKEDGSAPPAKEDGSAPSAKDPPPPKRRKVDPPANTRPPPPRAAAVRAASRLTTPKAKKPVVIQVSMCDFNFRIYDSTKDIAWRVFDGFTLSSDEQGTRIVTQGPAVTFPATQLLVRWMVEQTNDRLLKNNPFWMLWYSTATADNKKTMTGFSTTSPTPHIPTKLNPDNANKVWDTMIRAGHACALYPVPHVFYAFRTKEGRPNTKPIALNIYTHSDELDTMTLLQRVAPPGAEDVHEFSVFVDSEFHFLTKKKV